MKRILGISLITVSLMVLLGGCIIFSPPGILDKWSGSVNVTSGHPFDNGNYAVTITFSFDPLINPNHINGGTMVWTVPTASERDEVELDEEERIAITIDFNITSGDFTGTNLVFFATEKAGGLNRKVKFEGSVTGSKGSHSSAGNVTNQSGGGHIGTFTIGEQ